MRNLPPSVRFTALTVPMLPILAGCGGAGDPAPTTAPAPLPPPGPRQVLVQSAAVASGDEARPTSEQFAEMVRKAMASPVPDAVGKLVARRPDSALDLLRETAADEGARPDRLSTATAYDALFAGAPDAGWSTALRRQAAEPTAYLAYRRARSQVLSLIAAGKPDQAAKVAIVGSLPSHAPIVLEVEARQTAGLAAFLADDLGRAIEHWSAAVGLAGACPRPMRMELYLLLAEAHRRSRNLAGAAEAWSAAVSAGIGVNDPDLWERALAGRPATAPWPDAVIAAWRKGASPHDDLRLPADASAELADGLMRIGKMRLSRRAPQAALLAFSRAEAETDLPAKKALARLYRVHVMIGLQQMGTAAAMLEELVRHPAPSVARRAQAMLGYIQCRFMDSKRGLSTLREAVSAADGGEWPDKSRSMADLGLCLLLAGHEKEGLVWLHEAQFRFEREGLLEDLAQSLANEFEYLRSVDKPEQAERVRLRTDELHKKLGLPPLTATARVEPRGK